MEGEGEGQGDMLPEEPVERPIIDELQVGNNSTGCVVDVC